MPTKGNIIQSILTLKCPKCHKGEMFQNKNIYQYKGFFNMPDKCSECSQDFQKEPGFYFGAMYVSYALTIAINIAIFVILLLFDVFSIKLFLILMFPALLLSMPYVFKVSRAIWLSLFVK